MSSKLLFFFFTLILCLAQLSTGQFVCSQTANPCITIQPNGTAGFCIVDASTCNSWVADPAGTCLCTIGSENPLVQTSPGTVGDTVTCDNVIRDVVLPDTCFNDVIMLNNWVPVSSFGTSTISDNQQKEYVFTVNQAVQIGKIRLQMTGFDNNDNHQNVVGLYSKPDTAVKTVFNGPDLLTFFGNPVPAPDSLGLNTLFEFTPLNAVTFGPGQFSIFVTNGGGSDFNLVFEGNNPAPVSNSSIAATVGYFFYDVNATPDYGPSSLYNSITLFMSA